MTHFGQFSEAATAALSSSPDCDTERLAWCRIRFISWVLIILVLCKKLRTFVCVRACLFWFTPFWLVYNICSLLWLSGARGGQRSQSQSVCFWSISKSVLTHNFRRRIWVFFFFFPTALTSHLSGHSLCQLSSWRQKHQLYTPQTCLFSDGSQRGWCIQPMFQVFPLLSVNSGDCQEY